MEHTTSHCLAAHRVTGTTHHPAAGHRVTHTASTAAVAFVARQARQDLQAHSAVHESRLQASVAALRADAEAVDHSKAVRKVVVDGSCLLLGLAVAYLLFWLHAPSMVATGSALAPNGLQVILERIWRL